MNSLNALRLPITLLLLTCASMAQAHDRGDRMEHRWDARGDRINHRFERRSERQEALGHDVRASRLERVGDRIDHRFDRIGERREARFDRRH